MVRCSVLLLLVLLSGCSRIDLSDIATTTGATAGAATGAVIGGVPAVVALTVAGGAAGAALVEDNVDANDACIENPEACASIQTGQTIRDFIHWIIGGGVFLIIVAWLIPGPQLTWRRNHAKSNRASNRTGSGWGN